RGDRAQGKRVARRDICFRRAEHGVSDLQTGGMQDVPLLTVGVVNERDVRSPVGIVLDGRHSSRDTELVALEVDRTIQPLVAAAAEPRRDAPRIVTTLGTMAEADELLA